MPILKRVKLPLYYMNKRGKQISFNLIDTTLYIRPENYDLVDAIVVENNGIKNEKMKKSTEKRMKMSIAIQFKDTLTKSQRKAVHDELKNALEREKANRFFANLVKNTVNHSIEESEPIVKKVETLRKERELYKVQFKKSTKKEKDCIVIGFTPNKDVPSAFVNTEMIESFLYEVSKVEVSHIVDIKSIKAKYNK